MIRLTLRYPPSVNRYWRNIVVGGFARTLLSKEARDFKKHVASYCVICKVKRLSGPLTMTVDLYRPRKIGDIDAPIKGLMDALQDFAYDDDKQIEVLLVRRFDDKANPRVEVVIAQVPESPDSDPPV